MGNSNGKMRMVEDGKEVELAIADERKRSSNRSNKTRKSIGNSSDNSRVRLLEGQMDTLTKSRERLQGENGKLMAMVENLQQQLNESHITNAAAQRSINMLLHEVHTLKRQLKLTRGRLGSNNYRWDSSEPSVEGSHEEIACTTNSLPRREKTPKCDNRVVEQLPVCIMMSVLVDKEDVETARDMVPVVMKAMKTVTDRGNRLVDYRILCSESLNASETHTRPTLVVSLARGVTRAGVQWLNDQILQSSHCLYALLHKPSNREDLCKQMSASRKCRMVDEISWELVSSEMVDFLQSQLPPIDDMSLLSLCGTLSGRLFCSHQPNNTLHTEILDSLLSRSECFVSRAEESKLDEFLGTGNSTNSIMIVHQPGSGASSLISQLIKREKSKEDTMLLYHFCVDRRSLFADAELMMRRFSHVLGLQEHVSDSTWLNNVCKGGQRTLIFIDDVDLMTNDGIGDDLHWLTSSLPPNVRLILTCTQLPQQFKHLSQIELGLLSEEEDRVLIGQLLQSRDNLVGMLHEKKTSACLRNISIGTVIASYLPSLSLFKVESELEELVEGVDVGRPLTKVCSKLLSRLPQALCSLSYTQVQLVWKILGVIAASREGLSRWELEEMEPGMREVWHVCMPVLSTFAGGILRVIAGLYTFTNAVWREALADLLDNSVVQLELISYWIAYPSWRSVDECLWLLTSNTSPNLSTYLLQPHVFVSLHSRSLASQRKLAWSNTWSPRDHLLALVRERSGSDNVLFLLSVSVACSTQDFLNDSTVVMIRSALEIMQGRCGASTVAHCVGLLICSVLHRALGRLGPAEKYCTRGIHIATSLLSESHMLVQIYLAHLINILTAQNKVSSAERVYTKLLSVCGDSTSLTSLTNLSLPDLLIMLHNVDDSSVPQYCHL